MKYTTLSLENNKEKSVADSSNTIGIAEQETSINFGRGHDNLSVWTNDITEIRFIQKYWIDTGKALSYKYDSFGALTAELPTAYLTRNKPRKESKRTLSAENIVALQRGRQRAKREKITA